MPRYSNVTYLEWAKTPHGERYSLSYSYFPPRNLTTLARELGFEPAEVDSWPPTPQSHFALTELIANRFNLPMEQVLTVGSCSLANFLACAAVLDDRPDHKREVLTESPTYTPLWQQATAAGGQVRAVDVWQKSSLNIEPLLQAISDKTALIILANPNNPTGLLYTNEQLAALCDRAANYGAYVLVDEVYREYSPTAAPAIHLAPNAISTESLSKVYGLAELKVGWMLGPKHILERAQMVYDHLSVSIPYLNRDWALRILSKAWDRLISEARELSDQRKKIVTETLAKHPELGWNPPQAGLVGVLEPQLPLSTDAFASRLLLGFQTNIVPGRFFDRPSLLRLGFGGANLENALHQLITCAQSKPD